MPVRIEFYWKKELLFLYANWQNKLILDQTTYDLLAFIALSLKEIEETIDISVAAWEKRGYWVKADRYRMEWNWSARMGDDLKQSLLNEDWGRIANIIAQITQKLSKVNVSAKTSDRYTLDWLLGKINTPKSKSLKHKQR